ncbi:hypothetical protein FOXYS1_4770 [Fusarium oxysporum]|uniref:PD-(D/E)XK nuclease-like domain-containing protein n=1 Tax=Fusarium oxysporum TaxID=5507 RepID=A0A8H5AFL7_FUSOX|nr:hypothetical protein FOXYS1_4770 [Fusarium oxysporum]
MGRKAFEFIETWLEKIPQPQKHSPIDTQRPAKRQKLNRTRWRLPSPERSVSSSDLDQLPQDTTSEMDPQTPNKRRLVDDEATPRPNKAPSNSSRSSFNKDGISFPPSDSSQRSGRSSPVKTFPIVGLDGHYIDARTLDPDQFGFPSALEDILRDINDIGSKIGIVPEYLKPEIQKPSQQYKSLKWLNKSAYISSQDFGLDSDNLIPADRFLSTVENLRLFARRCFELGLDEAGWNNEVHTPILQAVFRGDLWPENAIVDYFPCMNASVTPEYHKFPISPSKVDYCVFIDPAFDNDDGVKEAIKEIQAYSNGTINHTSYSGLAQFPTCISIETKRHGGDQRRADVQTATWHASQWTYLTKHAGDGISELPFLPGVIVQGHEWKFVATTRNGKETIFWSSHQFGNTTTPVGVFQIMAGLHRLRRWSRDVYWPWYKKHVLKLLIPTQIQSFN